MKKFFNSGSFHAIGELTISITVLWLVMNSIHVNRQMHRIMDNQTFIVKAMDALADGMVKKATWDKEVAEKIRALNEYTKTNQIIQGTVH